MTLILGVAVHNAVSSVLTGSPDPPGIGPASGYHLCRLGAAMSRPARSSCSTEAEKREKARVAPGSHLTWKRGSRRKWRAGRSSPVRTTRACLCDSRQALPLSCCLLPPLLQFQDQFTSSILTWQQLLSDPLSRSFWICLCVWTPKPAPRPSVVSFFHLSHTLVQNTDKYNTHKFD